MPRPTIEQIRSVTDFAPMYRWEIGFSQNPIVFAGLTSEDLDLRCESAELPKSTNTPIEINIRGHKIKQPGITNYQGTLPLTFIETVDSKISRLLKNWREACWEPNTGVSRPKKDLEVDVVLTRLDNEDNPIWEYTMLGCFCEDYEAGGTMDGVSSEVLKPILTLSYDYFTDTPL